MTIINRRMKEIMTIYTHDCKGLSVFQRKTEGNRSNIAANLGNEIPVPFMQVDKVKWLDRYDGKINKINTNTVFSLLEALG
jgi:hypothetical protein